MLRRIGRGASARLEVGYLIETESSRKDSPDTKLSPGIGPQDSPDTGLQDSLLFPRGSTVTPNDSDIKMAPGKPCRAGPVPEETKRERAFLKLRE